eukprot:12142554-Alexandrium_andersonii.AAC.1
MRKRWLRNGSEHDEARGRLGVGQDHSIEGVAYDSSDDAQVTAQLVENVQRTELKVVAVHLPAARRRLHSPRL